MVESLALRLGRLVNIVQRCSCQKTCRPDVAILSKEGTRWLVGGTKHKGKRLEEVAKEDPGYLKWIFRKASEDLPTDAFNYLSDVLEKFKIDPYKKDKRPPRRVN